MTPFRFGALLVAIVPAVLLGFSVLLRMLPGWGGHRENIRAKASAILGLACAEGARFRVLAACGTSAAMLAVIWLVDYGMSLAGMPHFVIYFVASVYGTWSGLRVMMILLDNGEDDADGGRCPARGTPRDPSAMHQKPIWKTRAMRA